MNNLYFSNFHKYKRNVTFDASSWKVNLWILNATRRSGLICSMNAESKVDKVEVKTLKETKKSLLNITEHYIYHNYHLFLDHGYVFKPRWRLRVCEKK